MYGQLLMILLFSYFTLRSFRTKPVTAIGTNLGNFTGSGYRVGNFFRICERLTRREGSLVKGTWLYVPKCF